MTHDVPTRPPPAPLCRRAHAGADVGYRFGPGHEPGWDLKPPVTRIAINKRRFGLALLAPLALLGTTAAHAAVTDRLSVRGEMGVGSMMSGHQRSELGYAVGLQNSLRLGLSATNAVGLQLTYSHWGFPHDTGWGRANLIGGGFRFEPARSARGRFFIDGNLGLGITGPHERFMFDGGLGFELDALPWLAVGPALRYGQLTTGAGDVPIDPKFWSLGAAVTVRQPARPPQPKPSVPEIAAAPAPPPLPKDRDGDGIPDGTDLCPDQPAGPNPDPARAGCPRSDADRDGVFDDLDVCPTTPAGPIPDPERPGCPDADDDNDGVFNHRDQCRNQHHGINPDPARPGCPLPDRDGDSVPDLADACPDKPGAPHADPKKNGCPGLVLVEGSQIVILRPVYFATLKDRILPKSHPVLKAVAQALKSLPEIRLVAIEGHTDDRGDDAFNLDLSQRRANNVRQFLIDQGIDSSRLKALGFGKREPIDSNRTARGRAKNRRVEFKIIDPAPASPGAERS
jgi:outer membrane protein OmpA-like peptidoglycan-associated protein